jgi:hypothetical protein
MNDRETIMNSCQRINDLGAAGTALKAVPDVYGHSRRKTHSRPSVVAEMPRGPNLRATSAGHADSRDPPTSATVPANSPWSHGLLNTQSERHYLTFEMVQHAFSGNNLTLDDLAAVWRTLGQAAGDLVEPSGVEAIESAAHTAAEELAHLKSENAPVQNRRQQTDEAQPLPREAETALIKRMEDADREMRQILYGVGFAAHEHIDRAERLLAHPSEESLGHLVAAPEIRGSVHYLRILPNLVKQVRALDHRAAVAYREWRQTLGQPNGQTNRAEFGKLDRELQQTLPGFCYQAKVIQKMIALAQGFAAKFRASQHVLERARRCGDPVCLMPRVDVERQTIEAMEAFVRMPCDVFLLNCSQLEAAETRFQQARCELIQNHLHLVASIAGRYSNGGLTLPELIGEGISGLIRAVEEFGYRHEWRFSTYAACWIRRSIRDALESHPCSGRRPPPLAAGQSAASSGRPNRREPACQRQPGRSFSSGMEQDEARVG